MAQLTSDWLIKLEGKTIEVGGKQIYFEKGQNSRPAAWGGGEGYAAPVKLLPGDERHFLKLFRLPSSERRARAEFLAKLDLATLPLPDILFEAAPWWPISGTVLIPDVGEEYIEGHLARRIPGARFETLIQQEGWHPEIEARIQLARQLCSAVEVLERAGLVHGDISSANVMVINKDGDRPSLRLIDFDGFHHAKVPAVPYTNKDKGGRAWGTPGYRAPTFQRRPDVVVTTDRVAMAVLTMEIITLYPDDELPGDTFIPQSSIDARAPELPDEIIERWPAGWDLLCQAVAAADPADAPSPLAWRRELSRLHDCPSITSMPPPPRSMSPFLMIQARAHGELDRQIRLKGARGTFREVDLSFEWLSYTLMDGGVHLEGQPPMIDGHRTVLFVRFGGQGNDSVRYEGDIFVDVKAGDVIVWDEFHIYLL